MNKRCIIIILDSFGIGSAADAALYGDAGAHTLGGIAAHVPSLQLPSLKSMGLGNIEGSEGLGLALDPCASYGRLQPAAAGKDTTTGHWELAGLILNQPFPTYPDGFPGEVIEAFEKAIGREILGNEVASGTEIIEKLGPKHLKTGQPIVYTSADSVFQIAAHESIIPPSTLYDYCRKARSLLKPPHGVGRVIARPFSGQPGHFQRTAGRLDFSLEPMRPTLLDLVKSQGLAVQGVGKISDIFAGRGLTASQKSTDNDDGVDKTLALMRQPFSGLLMTNLVDFDMLYGHRNDVEGYAKALMQFDRRLPEIIDSLKDDDMLMITADHGCDPTFPGSDHTRENVPLLIKGKNLAQGVNLGTRKSFSDVAATAAQWLNLPLNLEGQSFLDLLR